MQGMYDIENRRSMIGATQRYDGMMNCDLLQLAAASCLIDEIRALRETLEQRLPPLPRATPSQSDL